MVNDETWKKALRDEFYGKKPSSKKYLAILLIVILVAFAFSFLAQEFKIDFSTNEDRRTQTDVLTIASDEDALQTTQKTSTSLQNSLGIISEIKDTVK